MDTTRHLGYHGHCRHNRIIHQTLWIPLVTTDTMGTADTRKPYTTHYGHHQAPRSLWAQQTQGNHTPDTMDTTRHHGWHGYCIHLGYTRHHGHQKALWTPWELQKTGNHKTDTMDTTRHHGTAKTREPYTKRRRLHKAPWTPWALQTLGTIDATKQHEQHGHYRHPGTIHHTLWTTPGNHSPHSIGTTRNHGHHGHCLNHGNIHQTLWTPPGTMDTMGTADTKEPYNRHYGYHQEPWALPTQGNHTPDTNDTTSHPMDNMGTADTREPYTRHYGHHQASWTP